MLDAGAKLACFEILAPLGAGGMGEVYRARDTKLGRDVALKVLPEAFAADSDRMARFEREAKLLASLNHPNIAAIYGFEDSSGTGVSPVAIRALVMELVEGPTLGDRIQQGAIPLDEALPIAKQVAGGLEYAHERGVVHRDLKPAHIKLRPDGAVKVLDFGLAKALEGDAPPSDASHSPTLSRLATQAGIILGTAAYMAPEQAKGKAVDRRADIWAFGCALYEMLAGKPAFGGETVTDTLAEIIKAEPEWSALPRSTAPRTRALLGRCLEKDPRQRLQAIGEARIAIEQTLAGKPEPAESRAPAPTLPLWRRALPWAAGIALAIAVGVVVWALRPQPASPPIVEFSLAPPEGASFIFHNEAPLALSPNGAELAFRAERGSALQIFLRRLDHRGATPLPPNRTIRRCVFPRVAIASLWSFRPASNPISGFTTSRAACSPGLRSAAPFMSRPSGRRTANALPSRASRTDCGQLFRSGPMAAAPKKPCFPVEAPILKHPARGRRTASISPTIFLTGA